MQDNQPGGPVPEGGDGMTRAPGDLRDRPGVLFTEAEDRFTAAERQDLVPTADPGDRLITAEDEDRLAAALDDLAVSAERTSAEQQVIADSARAMSEERRRGRPWAAILAGEGQPSVVGLLGSSLRRLSQTSSRVRTAVASALAKEGLSTRQIAAHLDVTHQRVSAMLNRPKP
jgi:hypothetical protein